MIFKKNGRRKASNFVLDSRQLARHSIPFGIIIIASFAVIVKLFTQMVIAFSFALESIPPENFAVVLELREMEQRIFIEATAGMVIIAAIALLLWIFYSHRIFGPVVAIRKHLKRLQDEQYGEKIVLRRYDEFTDLAVELNELSDKLNKRKSK